MPGSTILTGVLHDLVEIFFGDEARTRTNVPGAVRRFQSVGCEACLELRIRFQDLADLRRIGGVVLLHDREHGDRNVALQVRLLIDCELDRAVLDPLRDVVGEIEGDERTDGIIDGESTI